MNFSSTTGGILQGVLQRLLPVISTFLLLVLAYVPGMIPGLGSMIPPLPLIALFYWSIHRPDWFGVIASFIMGLMVDLLLAAPLGVTAGLYAIAHLLLVQQQRFFRGSPFYILWTGYAVAQLFVSTGQMLCWWYLADVTPHIRAWTGSNLFGLAIFPLVATGLAWLHKRLLK